MIIGAFSEYGFMEICLHLTVRYHFTACIRVGALLSILRQKLLYRFLLPFDLELGRDKLRYRNNKHIVFGEIFKVMFYEELS